MIHGKFIENETLTKSKLNLAAPEFEKDPVRLKEFSTFQAEMLASNNSLINSIQVLSKNGVIKKSCRIVTTTDIPLVGLIIYDLVQLELYDRVLVIGQTDKRLNGLYVALTEGWVRTADADSNEKLADGALVLITEGLIYQNIGFVLTTDNVNIDVSDIEFETFNLSHSPIPFKGNIGMQASITNGNGSLACNTGLLRTPALNGCVSVYVSHLRASLGDGVKTKSCYFSADNGVTAKVIEELEVGDKLYWNGSIAKVELDEDDVIDIEFNV